MRVLFSWTPSTLKKILANFGKIAKIENLEVKTFLTLQAKLRPDRKIKFNKWNNSIQIVGPSGIE